MSSLYPTTPDPNQLGQLIGRDTQGRLLAELHHATAPEFLQFFIVVDDSRVGIDVRRYLCQVVDIAYARQASNDPNFGVYLYRRSQQPHQPLSENDLAIIGRSVVALRLLGNLTDHQITECFTLPRILSFVRHPTENEYALLVSNPLLGPAHQTQIENNNKE
ncbi:MAG: hypothetical protein HXX20_00100 [Chloroflexi bacterium]|nr:hypothetical protein [Chloroflexota bacterium]